MKMKYHFPAGKTVKIRRYINAKSVNGLTNRGIDAAVSLALRAGRFFGGK
jgi:hypothetical protein